MQLQIISDFHSEWREELGKAWIRKIDPSLFDVLILPGDIAVADQIPECLGYFCKQAWPKPVLYVLGNHEFYGSSRTQVVEYVMKACEQNSNLRWLDHNLVVINGQRFLGTPLWYPPTDQARTLERFFLDFEQIKDLASWVYEHNARATTFLQENLKEGDVVISHMLPSQKCVSPHWKKSPINCYFVSDHTDLIQKRKPKLWVHGHTHDSLDFKIGSTRVVCNPCGYYPNRLNWRFNPSLIVEV